MELVSYFHKMGFVAYPLAICSIVCIAIFLERLIFYIGFFNSSSSKFIILENQITKHSDKPKAIRDEIISIIVTDRRNMLYGGFKWFRLIGMISPMLGLLGTISGLIVAFMKIAEASGSVNPALVADGLWEAMLTTAFGLTIALPALISLHLFKLVADRHLDENISRLNQISLEMEGVKI